MKLSIIIVSYNTKELTKACIMSVVGQYKKQLMDGEFEIIVVDNASSDNTVATVNKQLLTHNKKYLRMIQNKKNYGFSKGNNIGAKKTRGKYLMFLNSDTKVLDKGLLRMMDFLERHERIGILGGRLQNKNGSSQASAGNFYNLINVFFMLLGGERLGLLKFSLQKITKVDWVSGGAMMVRRNVFERLRGFDEAFFMYVEDMEFCFRAKKLGLLTYFYPNVTIVHKELGSSNRSFAIISIYKGLLYFYKKHKNSIQYTVVKLLLMAKACIAIVVGMFTNNTYLTSTYRKTLSLSL